MAYCPQCKQQYTGTECPTHRVPLVDELPFQTVEAPNTTWVEIATANTENEAKILQGFLEEEGIPCQIESLKFTMEPVNLGKMGEIRVYVAAENQQQALELLRKRDEEYERLRTEEDIVTDEGPAEIDENEPPIRETEQA